MRHTTTLKAKSKTHTVEKADSSGWRWNVTSGASGTVYTVWESGDSHAYMCSCDWAKYRPADGGGRCACSHVLAVIAWLQGQEGRTIQTHTETEQAEKQHRRIMDIGDGVIITTRLKTQKAG